jgi:hypothetical protein
MAMGHHQPQRHDWTNEMGQIKCGVLKRTVGRGLAVQPISTHKHIASSRLSECARTSSNAVVVSEATMTQYAQTPLFISRFRRKRKQKIIYSDVSRSLKYVYLQI